jgi:hypothetical protein
MTNSHGHSVRRSILVSGVMCAVFAGAAFGQSQYNPGTPTPNPNMQQRYNSQTGNYEMTTPGAELRYNANTGGYNYSDPNYRQPAPYTPPAAQTPPPAYTPYSPYQPNYGPQYPR